MRFVSITLAPPDIGEEIDALRRPWNEAVGAQEALRYPPHLTLRTGLVCPDDQAAAAAATFLDHARSCRPATLTTQGLFFTTYGEPGRQRGMVGWSVASSESLWTLHQGLLEFKPWAKGPQGEFRPHLTLAFDDLGPEGVEILRQKARASGPVPDFSWTADHVALYHETPERWVEWGRVPLKADFGG